MNNLQSATPVAATASVRPTAAANDSAAESAALPWSDVLQAVLAQQEKGTEISDQLPSLTDPAAASSVDTGDIKGVGMDQTAATADAVLTVDQSGLALPLLAALLPSTPATPAPTVSQASGVAATGLRNVAGIEQSGATNTELIAKGDPQATRSHEAVQGSFPTGTTHGAGNAPITPESTEHDTDLASQVRNSSAPNAQAPVQMTSAPPPLMQAAAPQTPQLHLHAAVNSAAWGAELGQKVVLLIGEKQHVAELHLNPPELGPLDIKLTVNEHQTTAVFTSPHIAVRDAVESALPRLREVLADSGITLGNASVTSDSARDGAAFAAPEKQHRNGYPSQDAVAKGPSTTGNILLRRGLVDLFA